eukprot:COSAG02_NODE_37165_length_445_cov_1.130058_1_plen_60_part_10
MGVCRDNYEFTLRDLGDPTISFALQWILLFRIGVSRDIPASSRIRGSEGYSKPTIGGFGF